MYLFVEFLSSITYEYLVFIKFYKQACSSVTGSVGCCIKTVKSFYGVHVKYKNNKV